jgi:hypothetical protein
MLNLNCPSCGAGLQLRGTPYGVCKYCQSLLLRSDTGYETVGKVAEVPDDFSPFQLGTQGYFENQHFALIGRVRKSWEQGSWNEWCALFDGPINGQHYGWLGEAQGELVMCFEQPRDSLINAPALDKLDNIQTDEQWCIGGKNYAVSDTKQVTCDGAEGELADFDQQGQALLSVDLRGQGTTFATVEFGKDDISVFTGKFVEFAECRFSNLRQLDGWTR